jgi:hypothetical protein
MKLWPSKPMQQSIAVLCTLMLASSPSYAWQQGQPATGNPQLLNNDQLDSLVAPLALYPDPILSQVLVASTYPLEIVQADRWYKQNTGLTGKALTDAATKQPWDASVQALVAMPDLLQQLDKNINWTTDVGNAFLAQESDVMSAVQRMRQKAQANGKLQSTPQQTVTTETQDNSTYIEIQPANPQVVYVPQYDPAYIWGPSAYYPYPSYIYPSGFVPGVIGFGTGFAIGALWGNSGWGWHGGWGWNAGWGHRNVLVNNNFFTRNNFNRVNANGNVWSHNAMHRQGVPYRNANVANRYNNLNVNRGNQINNRPTVNQTQQRLNQMNRADRPMNGMPGRGGAGQLNPNLGGRGGQGQGTANRVQPGLGGRTPGQMPNVGGQTPGNRLPQGGRNPGQMPNIGGQGTRFGGANRQMPAQMPQVNRGGFGGSHGFGGGRPAGHFGGGGMRRGGGGGGGRRR